MTWRVQRADVEQFRRDLWKDERSFRKPEGLRKDEFAKDCFDESGAQLELAAIGHLLDRSGEPLCPTARLLHGSQIALRKIDGIRLFDLVRMLRQIEQIRRDGRAASAEDHLMKRQRGRLAIIQRTLFAHRNLSTSIYPMESKLTSLLSLLSRVFGSDKLFEQAHDDLSQFGTYWRSHCGQIPFRDATIKNTLVEESRLHRRLFDDDVDRLAELNNLLLGSPQSYWDEVPLWDIDFSSVEHLTTPEDDPISLHLHEWTDSSGALDASSFVLIPDLFKPDPYRAAATVVVRYMRFGGRKLAYKVINAQGFEVRFRYDNPLFYFQRLRGKCASLSPEFVEQHPILFDLIEDIARRASNPSPADEALLRIDHFRKHFTHSKYWQESPNERADGEDPAVA